MKSNFIKLCFLFCCLSALKTYAQNGYFFNHDRFNPSYFNPAWTGVEGQAFVAAQHRTQWAGYNATFDPEGALTTQLVSLVVPVKGKLSGLGLSISEDQNGPLRTVEARLSLATSFSLKSGQLHLGIMPALNAAAVNANYRPADQDLDPLIPVGGQFELKPNLHAGIIFESGRDYFVGASVLNILEPEFAFGTEASNRIRVEYDLFLGKNFRLSRKLLAKPTVLLRSDLLTYTLELSGILEYQEKMWVGLAYRRSESISLLLGYSFLEDLKLKVGYSFDYVINEREAKEPTSHEIFVKYNLPNLTFGGRKAVKTPRFAF